VEEANTELLGWANQQFADLGREPLLKIYTLRQEASFRSYYRLSSGLGSFVGVFSPPDQESNQDFIHFAEFFKNNNVRVPEIICSDPVSGYMIVEDFGDKLYQTELSRRNYLELYSAALDEIIAIQSCPLDNSMRVFTKEIALQQMSLFRVWFLEAFLEMKISNDDLEVVEKSYQVILSSFFDQPKALCHFDFESRNLMVLEDGCAGVLDFQDAIVGPIFLDPVSLLKDLDHAWTDREISGLLNTYLLKAKKKGLLPDVGEDMFIKWFDFAGMQRQLRILGVLCRLHLRDNKSYRLVDLETTLIYIIEASKKYDELSRFVVFLESKVLPMLRKKMTSIK